MERTQIRAQTMSIPSPASDTPGALTLRQLAALVGRSLAVPALQSRWVVAVCSSDLRNCVGTPFRVC